MTRVILVDPKNELILHSIAIETKGDAQRFVYYWKKEERERQYQIERILVSGGFCRIMDPDEPVPVPPPTCRAMSGS
jgi:hypothetical protein